MSNTLHGFDDESGFGHGFDGSRRSGLSSSVLLTAILCLVFVVVLITILHLYARYLLRRQHAQRRRAQAQFHRSVTHATAGFVVDHQVERPKTGLDPAAVASLPRFAYKKNKPASNTDAAAPADDCAVCLSQLEEGEMVRHLPACGHMFHDTCVDLWLHSHNTCPVCRRVVGPVFSNPAPAGAPAVEVVMVVQVGGGGDHGSSNPSSVLAQVTSSQLLMPPAVAGCGGGSQGQYSGHVEDNGALSRLASFRRMFSLERTGGRRQQQHGGEGPHHDLERQ